jgi:hypothetical protein
MITEIRLSQIKDTYTGNKAILTSLIKLLKESPRIPEIILLYKSPEWITQMQVYEPLPIYAYLIKALKLAYPDIKEQSCITLLGIVVTESFNDGLDILLESNKLKLLINKRDKFSQFSQLVNEAEVSDDSK